MNLKKINALVETSGALLFSWIYLPHVFFYYLKKDSRLLINRDLQKCNLNFKSLVFTLFVNLHVNRYFRSLYYYRLGPVISKFISWYRPGDQYFQIAFSTKIGGGLKLHHPYSTIINADVMGEGCSIGQNTTIGITEKGRPSIGSNVHITANCVIVGPVHIGNNVTIGAGSVVVKDIPDNCIAVGNPCKPIKFLNDENQ